MSQDLSLRTSPHYLDGVFWTLLGVPDVWAIVNSPMCLYEVLQEKGYAEHDWSQSLAGGQGVPRLYSTASLSGVGQLDLAPQSVVFDSLRTGIARQRPGMLLVTEMTPLKLVEDDLDAYAQVLTRELEVPARHVACNTYTRDALDGFEACLVALAAQVPVAGGLEPDTVAVIGHPWDRDQEDHRASVRTMEHLLADLGLHVAPTWPSGVPLKSLARAATARFLVALPLGWRAADLLAQRTGATVVRTGLPIGLGGTAAWLQQVGAATGREAQAQQAIEAGLHGAVPRLSHVVATVLTGKRVLVCAEPGLADGLRKFLTELGMEALGPMYRCRTLPGVQARLPDDPERPPVQHFDPSVRSVAELLEAEARIAPVDLVLGSSWERATAHHAGVPFLELGFPSLHHRPLTPAPFLGFDGALHLAGRIADALLVGRFEASLRRAAAARGAP